MEVTLSQLISATRLDSSGTPALDISDLCESWELNNVLAQWEEDLAAWAKNWKIPHLVVRHRDRLFRVSASLARDSGDEPKRPNAMNLLGADYQRIHEFLIEARRDGLIVAIVSNTIDICYHTNDLLLPSRALVHGRDMTGYNYRQSWKRDRDSDINDELNPQHGQLKELLHRDGVVKGYQYTLFRRMDSALCEYSTDFYLCRDYMGDEVRIGVSKPEDFAVLSYA